MKQDQDDPQKSFDRDTEGTGLIGTTGTTGTKGQVIRGKGQVKRPIFSLYLPLAPECLPLSLGDAVSGLIQIPRQVDLALVVSLVPSHQQ